MHSLRCSTCSTHCQQPCCLAAIRVHAHCVSAPAHSTQHTTHAAPAAAPPTRGQHSTLHLLVAAGRALARAAAAGEGRLQRLQLLLSRRQAQARCCQRQQLGCHCACHWVYVACEGGQPGGAAAVPVSRHTQCSRAESMRMCACDLRVSCMWLACGLHVACMWLACVLHVACMWLACGLHVACMWPAQQPPITQCATAPLRALATRKAGTAALARGPITVQQPGAAAAAAHLSTNSCRCSAAVCSSAVSAATTSSLPASLTNACSSTHMSRASGQLLAPGAAASGSSSGSLAGPEVRQACRRGFFNKSSNLRQCNYLELIS